MTESDPPQGGSTPLHKTDISDKTFSKKSCKIACHPSPSLYTNDMTTAENLTTGQTFVHKGETYTVSFTRTYVQTGIEMVRVYTDEKEMPFYFRRDREI